MTFTLTPIGQIRSELKLRSQAPRQGNEGGTEAWIDVDPGFADALDGLKERDDVIIVTWLHQADRGTMKVHPRGDPAAPLAGVFATRSPSRPNPLGLHRVTILKMVGVQLLVGPLEAIDGTPVVDIKPVLDNSADH